MKKLLENFRRFVNEEDPYGQPDLELGLDPSQDIEYWKEQEPEEDDPQMTAAAPVDIAPLPPAPEDWSTKFLTRAGGMPQAASPPTLVRPDLPPLRGPEGEIIASPETVRAAQRAAAEAPVIQDPSLDYTPGDMSVVAPEKSEELPPEVAAQVLPDFSQRAPEVTRVKTPDVPAPSAQPAPDIAVGGGGMPTGSPGRYTKTPPPPKMPSAADTQAALDWATQYSQAEKAGKDVAPPPPKELSDDDAQAALDWARSEDPTLDPEADLEDVEIEPTPEPEEWEDYGPPAPEEPVVAEPEEPLGRPEPIAWTIEQTDIGGGAEVKNYTEGDESRPELYEYEKSTSRYGVGKIRGARVAKKDETIKREGLADIEIKKGETKYPYYDKNGKGWDRRAMGVSERYAGLDAVETYAAATNLGPGFTGALAYLAKHESGGRFGVSASNPKASWGIFGAKQGWWTNGLGKPMGLSRMDDPNENVTSDKGYRYRKDGTQIGGDNVWDLSPEEEVEVYTNYAAQTWKRVLELGGDELDAIKAIKLRHRIPGPMWGTMARRAKETSWKQAYKEWETDRGDTLNEKKYRAKGSNNAAYDFLQDQENEACTALDSTKCNKFTHGKRGRGGEYGANGGNTLKPIYIKGGKDDDGNRLYKLKNGKSATRDELDRRWKEAGRPLSKKKRYGDWQLGVGPYKDIKFSRFYNNGTDQGNYHAAAVLESMGYSKKEAMEAAIANKLPEDYAERRYKRYDGGKKGLAKSWRTKDQKDQLRSLAQVGGGGAEPGGVATFRESKTISRDLIRQLVLETIDKRKKPRPADRDLIRDIVIDTIRNRKS